MRRDNINTRNIREAIADGEICSKCKEYIGEPKGKPVLCAVCNPALAKIAKIPCSMCGKKIKPSGMDNHIRDIHGRSNSA